MTDGKSMLGKIVKVTVDRPMGSFHPKHQNLYYPVNYGYIEGIPAPDGEEQEQIFFQEQYFQSEIILLDERERQE